MSTRVILKDAGEMMIEVISSEAGLRIEFADGANGLIPFTDIPEISSAANLATIDLPNPYEILLLSKAGLSTELPWDFARSYCDPSYRQKAEARALQGRQTLGNRVRTLRESRGLTQEQLANASGIGRVTLVRIENGDQSPRLETLNALAAALGEELSALVLPPTTEHLA